jgi:hypothetical protein
MSYCVICQNHNVSFSKVEGGWYCSGCDEIHYDDEMEKESAIRTLIGIKIAISRGEKSYGIFYEDIKQALKEAQDECKRLGIEF